MKTAVQWLVEQLAENGVIHSSDIRKAKEMEKEQIIKAYENTNSMAMYGEQYYKEKYESKR
jgi:hypothetical protein